MNVPWSKAAAEDGTFLPDDQLRALYAAAGLELLDQPNVKNYDGSWVECGSLVGVPVEK